MTTTLDSVIQDLASGGEVMEEVKAYIQKYIQPAKSE